MSVKGGLHNPFSGESRRIRQSGEENLAYFQNELDPKENRESTPPDDEHLEWHGVYVVEAYGPSHLGSLLDRVRRLGWAEEDDPRLAPMGSLADWIESSRGRSFGGGYFPLNSLRRERPSVGAGSRTYQAPLPVGVSYARGVVMAPTPALTLVVLLFAFEDALAGQVEATLRREFQTEQERSDGGWRIYSPAHQKALAVAAERQRLRARAAEFFRAHLPGAFTVDLERELPSCEVLTTTRFQPLEPPERPPRSWLDHVWTLDLHHYSEGWKSDDLPGFRLQLPSAFSSSPALVLAGRRDEVFANVDGFYGGPTRNGLAGYLHLRLDFLVGLWASRELLRGYHAVLGSTRDLRAAPARGPANVRQLSKVQAQLRRAADARTLAYELESAAEQRGDLVRWVDVDFEAVEPDRWRETTLVKTLLGTIRDEAVSLRQTEARVRENLVVDTNLLVHRTMVVLTWILLLIALVTLALRFW